MLGRPTYFVPSDKNEKTDQLVGRKESLADKIYYVKNEEGEFVLANKDTKAAPSVTKQGSTDVPTMILADVTKMSCSVIDGTYHTEIEDMRSKEEKEAIIIGTNLIKMPKDFLPSKQSKKGQAKVPDEYAKRSYKYSPHFLKTVFDPATDMTQLSTWISQCNDIASFLDDTFATVLKGHLKLLLCLFGLPPPTDDMKDLKTITTHFAEMVTGGKSLMSQSYYFQNEALLIRFAVAKCSVTGPSEKEMKERIFKMLAARYNISIDVDETDNWAVIRIAGKIHGFRKKLE